MSNAVTAPTVKQVEPADNTEITYMPITGNEPVTGNEDLGKTNFSEGLINIESIEKIKKQRQIWKQLTSTQGSLDNYPRPMGNLPMYEWAVKF